MRGLRSTIALLVVLVGLGAYIYFVTWKKPDERHRRRSRRRCSRRLEADKIDEIKVKSESGDTTTLKKSERRWQIVAPMSAQAPTSRRSPASRALSAQLEIVRVVDENPADLKDYGLDAPRSRSSSRRRATRTPADLLIGDKSPTGGDLFAKRNDEKRVFLIAGVPGATFNRSTFDLRDKTLLKFERDKVDGIEVTPAARRWSSPKTAPTGRSPSRSQARADYGDRSKGWSAGCRRRR